MERRAGLALAPRDVSGEGRSRERARATSSSGPARSRRPGMTSARSTRRRAATAWLAVAAALAACGPSATRPGDGIADVAGQWTGELDPTDIVPGGQRLPF